MEEETSSLLLLVSSPGRGSFCLLPCNVVGLLHFFFVVCVCAGDSLSCLTRNQEREREREGKELFFSGAAARAVSTHYLAFKLEKGEGEP